MQFLTDRTLQRSHNSQNLFVSYCKKQILLWIKEIKFTF